MALCIWTGYTVLILHYIIVFRQKYMFMYSVIRCSIYMYKYILPFCIHSLGIYNYIYRNSLKEIISNHSSLVIILLFICILFSLKTSLHAGGTHLAVLARGLSSYLSVALEVRDVDAIAGLVHAHVAQSLLALLGYYL